MSAVVVMNRDRTEFRKEVWRVIRTFGTLSVTELDMRHVHNARKGGYFYEDERGKYCDGRSLPEPFYFSLVSKRMIIFLPYEETTMTMTSKDGPLTPGNATALPHSDTARNRGSFVKLVGVPSQGADQPQPSRASDSDVPVSDPNLVLAANRARGLDPMGRLLD